MQIAQHNGKTYRAVRNGPFEGWIEFELPKGAPWMEYKGPKIPFDVWRTILAWFAKHKDNEVQVRLYVNLKLNQWRAVVLPQTYPSGMTVKELPDHEKTAEIRAELDGDWTHFGSVHHHCNGGAFQSGTDKTDEMNCPGIHITVGSLNSPRYSLHARVSIIIPGEIGPDGKLLVKAAKAFYENEDVTLAEWFETPKEARVLPPELYSQILDWWMTVPAPEGFGYPSRWDEMLIKPVVPAWTPQQPHYRGAPPSEPIPPKPFDGPGYLSRWWEGGKLRQEWIKGEFSSSHQPPLPSNRLSRKERKKKERDERIAQQIEDDWRARPKGTSQEELEADNFEILINDIYDVMLDHKTAAKDLFAALCRKPQDKSLKEVDLCEAMVGVAFAHQMELEDIIRVIWEDFLGNDSTNPPTELLDGAVPEGATPAQLQIEGPKKETKSIPPPSKPLIEIKVQSQGAA